MRAALLRFRVVAWVVGVFLLLLTLGVLLRYTDLFGVRTDVLSRTVSPIHGFGYMVYLATGLDLASKRRWRPLTAIGVLLAGTVPFLSFYAERRVTRDVRAAIARQEAAEAAEPAAGQPAAEPAERTERLPGVEPAVDAGAPGDESGGAGVSPGGGRVDA